MGKRLSKTGTTYKKFSLDLREDYHEVLNLMQVNKGKFINDCIGIQLGVVVDNIIPKLFDIVEQNRIEHLESTNKLIETLRSTSKDKMILTPFEAMQRAYLESSWLSGAIDNVGITPQIIKRFKSILFEDYGIKITIKDSKDFLKSAKEKKV